MIINCKYIHMIASYTYRVIAGTYGTAGTSSTAGTSGTAGIVVLLVLSVMKDKISQFIYYFEYNCQAKLILLWHAYSYLCT